MGLQVCLGAMMQCSFGAAPSSLVVPRPQGHGHHAGGEHHGQRAHGEHPALRRVLVGANPGRRRGTAAALGALTPLPCIPLTSAPWAPGSPRPYRQHARARAEFHADVQLGRRHPDRQPRSDQGQGCLWRSQAQPDLARQTLAAPPRRARDARGRGAHASPTRGSTSRPRGSPRPSSPRVGATPGALPLPVRGVPRARASWRCRASSTPRARSARPLRDGREEGRDRGRALAGLAGPHARDRVDFHQARRTRSGRRGSPRRPRRSATPSARRRRGSPRWSGSAAPRLASLEQSRHRGFAGQHAARPRGAAARRDRPRRSRRRRRSPSPPRRPSPSRSRPLPLRRPRPRCARAPSSRLPRTTRRPRCACSATSWPASTS